MRQPDYETWFAQYAELLTRSIHDRVEVAALREVYDEAFIASGPKGVRAARNTWLLGFVIRQAARFHRKVGTVETRVAELSVAPLFKDHDAVRVSYESDHQTPRGLICIPFEITYLMRRGADGQVRIFGFIGDDETEIYRRHGLVDAKGRPSHG